MFAERKEQIKVSVLKREKREEGCKRERNKNGKEGVHIIQIYFIRNYVFSCF